LIYFNSRKCLFPLKNPRKSILPPKIVKPFPENSKILAGDSPEGPLKQPGESCLKPAKNQSETPLT
jgi:hypothetical protein